MHRLAALITTAAVALGAAPAAGAAERAGEPDPGFGTAGRVSLALPGVALYPAAVEHAPDGDLLVLAHEGGSFQSRVFRLTPDGVLDPTFGGGDGIAEAPVAVAGPNVQGRQLAVGPGGTLYVAGRVMSGHAAVTRLDGTTGAVDASYGTAGVALVPDAGALSSDARVIAVRPDGRQVVAGVRTLAGGYDVLTGELSATTGTGTPGFSPGFDPRPAADAIEAVTDLLLVEGGPALLAIGEADIGDALYDDSAVRRIGSTGHPDPLFGAGGAFRFAGREHTALGTLERRPDGTVLAAGYTSGPDGLYAITGRIGLGGTAVGPAAGRLGALNVADAFAGLADGSIVVAGGRGLAPSGVRPWVGRLDVDGVRDERWDADGPTPGQRDLDAADVNSATAILVDGGRAIVASGNAYGTEDALVLDAISLNGPPAATLQVEPAVVRAGGTLRLAAAADDPDGPGALRYAFDADGDGTSEQTGAAATAEVSVPADAPAGTRTARMTVTDALGGEATATATYEIDPIPAAPTVHSTAQIVPAPVLGRTVACQVGVSPERETTVGYAWETSTDGTTFAPLAGAGSGRELAVTAAAVGRYLRCVATARNVSGTAASTSDRRWVSSGPPRLHPFPPLGLTKLPSVKFEDGAWRCSPGSWDGDPEFRYTWERKRPDGSFEEIGRRIVIGGQATVISVSDPSYVAAAGDEQKEHRCVVQATAADQRATERSATFVPDPLEAAGGGPDNRVAGMTRLSVTVRRSATLRPTAVVWHIAGGEITCGPTEPTLLYGYGTTKKQSVPVTIHYGDTTASETVTVTPRQAPRGIVGTGLCVGRGTPESAAARVQPLKPTATDCVRRMVTQLFQLNNAATACFKVTVETEPSRKTALRTVLSTWPTPAPKGTDTPDTAQVVASTTGVVELNGLTIGGAITRAQPHRFGSLGLAEVRESSLTSPQLGLLNPRFGVDRSLPSAGGFLGSSQPGRDLGRVGKLSVTEIGVEVVAGRRVRYTATLRLPTALFGTSAPTTQVVIDPATREVIRAGAASSGAHAAAVGTKLKFPLAEIGGMSLRGLELTETATGYEGTFSVPIGLGSAQATIAFDPNGKILGGEFAVDGKPLIPLFPGGVLEKLDGKIQANPTVFGGHARVRVLQMLRLDGTLLAAFPSTRVPWDYKTSPVKLDHVTQLRNPHPFTSPVFGVGGSVTLNPFGDLVIPLARGYVLAATSGYAEFGGEVKVDVPVIPLVIEFGASGVFQFQKGVPPAHRFTLDGHAAVKVSDDVWLIGGMTLVGADVRVSSIGVGACATVFGESVSARFNYRLGFKAGFGCGYLEGVGIVIYPAQAGGPKSFRVDSGREWLTVHLEGVDGKGVPQAILVDPSGRRYAYDGTEHGLRDGLIATNEPAYARASIGIRSPKAGRWQVLPVDGAPRALRVTMETARPELSGSGFRARVTRDGRARILHYTVPAGRSVAFEERASGVQRVLRAGVHGKGTLRFVPTEGRAGTRSVVAVAENAGSMSVERPVTVARFTAPGPRRLAAPRGLRVTRRGRSVTVRWRRVTGAREYRVVVTSGGSRQLTVVRATRAAATVTDPGRRVRVTVSALDTRGRAGRAAAVTKR